MPALTKEQLEELNAKRATLAFQTKLKIVMKLIRDNPAFFEELFSPKLLLSTSFERDTFINREGGVNAFDFSKLWDMAKGPSTKMLEKFKGMIEELQEDPRAYGRWRNIVDASIVRGAQGVRYKNQDGKQDVLSEFLKNPLAPQDKKFATDLTDFIGDRITLILKFAKSFNENPDDIKKQSLEPSSMDKTAVTKQKALQENREWLQRYRPLSEQITAALKESSAMATLQEFDRDGVKTKKLLNLLLASIKAKKDYFSLVQRSEFTDLKFARFFDDAINHIVIAIHKINQSVGGENPKIDSSKKFKASTNMGMVTTCLHLLANANSSDRINFVEYFLDTPEFRKVDDVLQLTMPVSFQGKCDINFEVTAKGEHIPLNLKSVSGGQEDFPGAGLLKDESGVYYTTAEALLAATATIIPMGTTPFSVPNKVGKETTAFAPTATFLGQGNTRTMQEVDIPTTTIPTQGNTRTKAKHKKVDMKRTMVDMGAEASEVNMRFAVALGKASTQITLNNIGPFNKVPEQKFMTKVDQNPSNKTYKFNINELLGLPKDADVGVAPIGTMLSPDRIDPEKLSNETISITSKGRGNFVLEYLGSPESETYNFDPLSKIRSTEMGFVCAIYPAPGEPVTQVVFTLDDLDFKMRRNKIAPKFNFMLPSEQICKELLKQRWEVSTPKVSIASRDTTMSTVAKAANEINKYVKKNLTGYPAKDLNLFATSETLRAMKSALEESWKDSITKSKKIDYDKLKDLALVREQLILVQQALDNAEHGSHDKSRLKPKR